MYAHIRQDLHLALAYVFLKFYRNNNGSDAHKATVFDVFKADFDVMNTVVFPHVMEQVARGEVIIPSISLPIPKATARPTKGSTNQALESTLPPDPRSSSSKVRTLLGWPAHTRSLFCRGHLLTQEIHQGIILRIA